MTERSPAAEAVLAAFNERHELCGPFDDDWAELCIAAALRAAAGLEGIRPEPVGECDERYGDPFRTERISEQDFKYKRALTKKQTQADAQRQLLAIAAELEGIS
jgi:hypothetical protein